MSPDVFVARSTTGLVSANTGEKSLCCTDTLQQAHEQKGVQVSPSGCSPSVLWVICMCSWQSSSPQASAQGERLNKRVIMASIALSFCTGQS